MKNCRNYEIWCNHLESKDNYSPEEFLALLTFSKKECLIECKFYTSIKDFGAAKNWQHGWTWKLTHIHTQCQSEGFHCQINFWLNMVLKIQTMQTWKSYISHEVETILLITITCHMWNRVILRLHKMLLQYGMNVPRYQHLLQT